MSALRTNDFVRFVCGSFEVDFLSLPRSGLSGDQWALALGAYYRLASQLVMSQSLTDQFLAETPADNLLIQGIQMGSCGVGYKGG